MLLEFLESLGLRFEMDWDDTVAIATPDAVLACDLQQALEPFRQRLANQVRWRAQKQRAVFVGGSLNGELVGTRRCLIPTHSSDGKTYRWIAHHVARSRWEVYDQESYDGRAFFRGYAANRRKANRGETVDRVVAEETKPIEEE